MVRSHSYIKELKEMKIALNYQIFTNQAYGGISRYYTTLAGELLKQEQEVSIFAGFHQNNYLENLPADIVRGRKLTKFSHNKGSLITRLNHAISQVQIKLWRPDIIHETYFSRFPRLKSEAVRVTGVYDMIHELYSEQFVSQDRTSDNKKVTCSQVDHILSISNSTKRDLCNLLDISEKKVSVVHLGVDLSAFQNPQSDFAYHHKPYLLFVGSRRGYKNFEGLIKAYASSKHLKSGFDIIAFGGGPFSYLELQMLNQYRLSERQVRQVSGDDRKLVELYTHAAALVYPSLYEGFGLPPLEAMAAGCPVISSNTSSMPEVVRAAGEYFDPKEVESIRNSIEHVVYSSERRNELIALGYENIKHFTWEKCAKETLRVYKKISGN